MVVLGREGEPVIGAVLARGAMVTVLFGTQKPPEDGARPVYKRVGTELRRVRVRGFFPFVNGGMWVSPGMFEWTRAEWIALWLRTLKHKITNPRIPRATVVQR
jgi:hypothetical protein